MKSVQIVFLMLPLSAAAATPEVHATQQRPGGSARAALLARARQQPISARGMSPRAVFSFAGDNVIPQLADGGGWQTTMKFVNLDARALRFSIYFFDDAGNDLSIDIAGIGSTTGLDVTLPVTEGITIETTGMAGQVQQGWAYIERERADDVLGGMCVFRARNPGRSDFEAIVPLVSEFDTRFVMFYENTRGYVTSMAIANPSLDTIQVDATIRDEDSNVLDRRQIVLGPFKHEAFSLPTRWPATANKRGVIEFTSTGWGASAMGLLFNPTGAFTSFHVLGNPNW